MAWKDLSKKENQHNEWRGKMLRDMSNKSKKFEHKSKELLEEKKSSISKKILQRLTPKPMNVLKTPKLKHLAGPVKRKLFGRKAEKENAEHAESSVGLDCSKDMFEEDESAPSSPKAEDAAQSKPVPSNTLPVPLFFKMSNEVLSSSESDESPALEEEKSTADEEQTPTGEEQTPTGEEQTSTVEEKTSTAKEQSATEEDTTTATVKDATTTTEEVMTATSEEQFTITEGQTTRTEEELTTMYV